MDTLEKLSATGMVSLNPNTRELQQLVQMSAVSLRYYNDFTNLLKSSYCIGGDLGKLFASIIDTTLHGGHKRTILSIASYTNVKVPEEMLDVFRGLDILDRIPDSEPEPLGIACIHHVLKCFHQTNNFKDGLKAVLDTSLHPSWSGTLYGQLAGAYYGLTDIDITWMDCVQKSVELLDSVNGWFNSEKKNPAESPVPMNEGNI
jgi:hypothetical protein